MNDRTWRRERSSYGGGLRLRITAVVTALLAASVAAGCTARRPASQLGAETTSAETKERAASTTRDDGGRSSSDAARPADAKVEAIHYIGSSTVANFLREADRALELEFRLDTAPESLGGERRFQDGEGDLAGMACEPSEETVARGIRAELIGVDALAVVVHMGNPVTGLRREELRGIFSGEISNWKELGGPDLDIVPHVVGPDSATQRVFRRTVLDDGEYGEHRLVVPDADMNLRVEAEPGGIGFISYSFLCAGGEVRVLTIDGEACLPDNRRYPLVRPLYLLWRPGDPRIESFIDWVHTPAARELIEKCFALPREIGWARWRRAGAR